MVTRLAVRAAGHRSADDRPHLWHPQSDPASLGAPCRAARDLRRGRRAV